MMFRYLMILFVILPALELTILIRTSASIGAGNTIMIIIITGIAGAYLARLQGFLVIRDIQTQIERGIMPTQHMLNGLMIFCGGILLLAPGLITDTIGFLLLIPYTRNLFQHIIQKKFEATVYREEAQPDSLRRSPLLHDDFEDADFHE